MKESFILTIKDVWFIEYMLTVCTRIFIHVLKTIVLYQGHLCVNEKNRL